MTGSQCDQFLDDMQTAGFEVRPYAGRFHWRGPAVVTDDRQAVVRATEVRLQWDNLGLGWVVYPVAADADWYEAQQ